MTWGLAQSKAVTAPFTLMRWVLSYIPPPWCANAGQLKMKKLASTARTDDGKTFMDPPPKSRPHVNTRQPSTSSFDIELRTHFALLRPTSGYLYLRIAAARISVRSLHSSRFRGWIGGGR